MINKFLSLSRIKQIGIAVCLLHFFAISALVIHHVSTQRLRPAKPISIRTFIPKAPPPVAVQTTQKKATTHSTAASAPQKKAVEKPAMTKQTVSQKAAKPSQTAVKKAAPIAKVAKESKPKPAEEKALKEIAESLQSIASASENTTSRPSITIPAPLSRSLKTPLIDESNCNPSYGEFLTAYLQSELELPEQGDVKVQIQIDSFGKLLDCVILDSRSPKNGEFLKNRLPELAFPCFNTFGITELTQTFTITFRNVENP